MSSEPASEPEAELSTDAPDDGRIVLPQVLDLAAAAPLRTTLLQHRGKALEIDGSEVERFGSLCLQVLLSARASWADDGQALHLTDPSAALTSAASLMGAHMLLVPQTATE